MAQGITADQQFGPTKYGDFAGKTGKAGRSRAGTRLASRLFMGVSSFSRIALEREPGAVFQAVRLQT
jgi:hypothetical protein